MSCPHTRIETETSVSRPDAGDGLVVLCLKCRVFCKECGRFFTWTGMETIPSPTRPWVSVDGHTLHVSVVLAAERPPSLDRVVAAIAAKLGAR